MLPTHRARLDSKRRSERSVVLSRRGMVCASVPAASAAGVAVLARGGNAVDAAIAAAAVLCVVEPMSTGIGGDAFALLWSARDGRAVGLNGSGRAPAAATLSAYRERGLESVPHEGVLAATVPGAVRAWEDLSQRYGRLPLGDVLAPAIRAAEEGFPVTELVAHYWWGLERTGRLRNDAARRTFAPGGRTPAPGSLFRNPPLAGSLAEIAKGGAAAFYEGPIADAIVRTSREEGGLFAAGDLREHTSTWTLPISASYRGAQVLEIPPNGQGITALIALGILACFEPAPVESALEWHRRIEAVKLAFADRNAYVADPEHAEVPVEALLDRGYARRRAADIGERATPRARAGLGGETVYLCAADAEGNLVSLIQSLFHGFGSGVACGDTGILLQNRGAGFRLREGHPNAIAPRKRPLHTIIPGMLLREGRPWMAFGLMGGDTQPQSHVNFVANLVDQGMNAQEAIDHPRFRFDGGRRVVVEDPRRDVAEGGSLGDALAARGHEVAAPGAVAADAVGGGQAVELLEGGVLAGASDRRKDGCAQAPD
jgi:gamma-glutamyltranspeptidase/glutathione hydrolase